FDARKQPGYAPYDKLAFEVPVLHSGDVNARFWLRIREVEQSIDLVEQITRSLPPGAICNEPAAVDGVRESFGLVEGFRGDILVWLRLGGDRVLRCHLR